MAEARATHKQILQCSAEQLKKAIGDYEQYPKHLDGLSKTTVLTRDGATSKVQYELNLIKTFRYVLLMTDAGWDIRWQLVEGDLFKKNEGAWHLKPISNNQVEATYELCIDLVVSFPSFMAKQIAGANLPKMFRQFEAWAKGIA